jgi:drug/metabolite transporter (DMT)-like permease
VTDTTSSRRPALAALALSLVVFAPSFAATKVSVDGLGVATSATIRLAGGGGILLLIAYRSWPILWRHRRPLALLGITGMGVQTYAISIGIDAGSASLGALILGIEPVCIALFGALLLRERPERNALIGLAFGLAGVVVVSGIVTVGAGGTPLRAVVALVITTVSFSIYAVRLPAFAHLVGGIPATAATMTAGGLAILPFALIEVARGDAVHQGARVSTIYGAGYNVLGQTVLGYALFVYAVARLRPALLAVMLYALPPLAVIADWVLIGERPHGRDIVGGGLILLGVAIGTRRASSDSGSRC